MATDKKPRKSFRGETARKWRRRVAERDGSTFTLKFPLESPAEELDFAAAIRLGNIVSGTGKGSLMGFLCAVLLSGFRLYPKSVRKTGAGNKLPNEAFKQSLQNKFGAEAKIPDAMTAQSIKERLVEGHRNKDGNSPQWTQEYLTESFLKKWKAPNNDMAQNVAKEIAKALYKEFNCNYDTEQENDPATKAVLRAINKDVPRAWKAIRSRLGEIDIDLPELPTETTENNAEIPKEMKDATICFHADREIPQEIDDECALHQAVALALRDCDKDDQNKDPSAKIRASITSANDSSDGLSWLFNRGWKSLRNEEYTPQQLVQWLPMSMGTTIDEVHVKRLCDYAKAVPEPPFFNTNDYADFRQQVGGKLRSWISNYYTRLTELQKGFAQEPDNPPHAFLPSLLDEEEVQKEILEGLHFHPEGIRQEIDEAARMLHFGKQLIDKFMGKADTLPTAEDIKRLDSIAATMEKYTAGLIKSRTSLNNAITATVARIAIRRQIGINTIYLMVCRSNSRYHGNR